MLNCVAELNDRFASIREDLGVAQKMIAQLNETCTNLAQEKMMLEQHELYEKTANDIISTKDEIISSYKEIVEEIYLEVF